jgi:hypothetical protein
VRKGIDKHLEVINVDLLEAEASIELVNTVLHLGVDNIAALGPAHVQPIAAANPPLVSELPQ